MARKTDEAWIADIREKVDAGATRKDVLDWLETQGVSKEEGRKLYEVIHEEQEKNLAAERAVKRRNIWIAIGVVATVVSLKIAYDCYQRGSTNIAIMVLFIPFLYTFVIKVFWDPGHLPEKYTGRGRKR